MDAMEVDDGPFISKSLTGDGLVTQVNFQRKKKSCRCVTTCLGLLLLAGNIGQFLHYYFASKDQANSDHLTQHNLRAKNEVISVLTTERNQLGARLDNLTRDKDQLQTSYDSLVKDRDELLGSKKALTAERDQLKVDVKGLQTNHSLLNREHSALQNQISALRADNGQLQASSDSLMKEMEILQTGKSSASAERDDLKSRFDNLKNENDHLQRDYSSLRRTKDQLQASYNSLVKERDLLQTSKTNLAAERDDFTSRFNRLKNDRDQLQNNYTLLGSYTDQLKASEGLCQIRTKLQQRQYAQLQASYNTMRLGYEGLQSNQSSLLAERYRMQKTIDKMTAKLTSKGMVCPDSWKEFGQNCYYITTTQKKWEDGRQECISKGGNLVVLNSREEQRFVGNLVGNGQFWIGMTDSATEGAWMWVDGTPVTTAHWQPGQPNNLNIQHCGEILGKEFTDAGLLNDEGCNIEQQSICEI